MSSLYLLLGGSTAFFVTSILSQYYLRRPRDEEKLNKEDYEGIDHILHRCISFLSYFFLALCVILMCACFVLIPLDQVNLLSTMRKEEIVLRVIGIIYSLFVIVLLFKVITAWGKRSKLFFLIPIISGIAIVYTGALSIFSVIQDYASLSEIPLLCAIGGTAFILSGAIVRKVGGEVLRTKIFVVVSLIFSSALIWGGLLSLTNTVISSAL